MFYRFDATKSTKGASKLRRDLINAEIANLRDLLPLPQSTRQRLSQLQLMALVCVYVRKANYFQQGKTFFVIYFFLSQGSNLDYMLNLYNNSIFEIIDFVYYHRAM